MNIETYFPYAAGSPPAVVLGINLYNAILAASGSQFWWLAAPVALFGVVGMIATEVYTYQMAARAFALKAWGALVLALAGAALCSAFVIFGVYSGANTKSLISNTIIAIAAYLALAIKKYLDTLKEEHSAVNQEQLNILTAQRLLNNSEARKIKAGVFVRQNAQPSNERPVDDNGHKKKLDPEKLAWVRAYYDKPENKGKSAASMIGAEGCPFTSRETARQYKAAL